MSGVGEGVSTCFSTEQWPEPVLSGGTTKLSEEGPTPPSPSHVPHQQHGWGRSALPK